MLNVCHYFRKHGLMGADVNSKPEKGKKRFPVLFSFLQFVCPACVCCVRCAGN